MVRNNTSFDKFNQQIYSILLIKHITILQFTFLREISSAVYHDNNLQSKVNSEMVTIKSLVCK